MSSPQKGKGPRIWVVLTFGTKTDYGTEYADKTRESYDYDSNIPNYTLVHPGDVMIVCDKQDVIGAARIDRIDPRPGSKQFRRCPHCNTTAITQRTRKAPQYRCKKCKREFEVPDLNWAACTLFTAYFGQSFVECKSHPPRSLLRPGCPKYNDRHAMRSFDLPSVADSLAGQATDLYDVLRRLLKCDETLSPRK